MNKRYEIQFDAPLAEVLQANNISLVFSTYQAGVVMILGSSDGSNLHQIPISYKKPMGIAIEGSKIAIAGLDEICFFSNNENIAETLKLNENNFDSVFTQRSSYNTGSIDVHDIHFGNGVLWGVNTLFSCLCTFDINYSFRPKWKPDFIKNLKPEDKCHLNGVAFEDDLPKYATALSTTATKEGWRDDIMNSGVIMEVPSSKIIVGGLAMPHSPRIFDGSLYVLESGKGNLLKVNIESGEYEIVYQFGRFLRGMTLHNGILFIATSKIRESSSSFNKLAVKDKSTHAGIIVFDLVNRIIIAELKYLNTIDEIYDIQLIKDANKPVIITQLDDRHKEIITFPGNVFWRKAKIKSDEITDRIPD